jgi:DNA replication and repair protein RecF
VIYRKAGIRFICVQIEQVHLKSLELLEFKNVEATKLDFSSKINCFTGLNGSGKTNLMDAIYYLSFCKSFLNPTDAHSVRHGEKHCMIQGLYDLNKKTERISISIRKGQKKIVRRNKKDYEKLVDHIGLLPLVLVSPTDVNLISEGSAERRKYLDGILSQFDSKFLAHLVQYGRSLTQRNALLKYFAAERHFDRDSIEVWDKALLEHGLPIHEKRSELCAQILPYFQEYYKRISGEREEVGLEYKSGLDETSFEDLLENHLDRDLALRYTSQGIHRDDLQFSIGGHPIRRFGSQGQQKSYLLALKLAQFAYLKEGRKRDPILLLDDLFDKLDSGRIKNLLELLNGTEFGQVFISDTDHARLKGLLDGIEAEVQYFSVEDGKVEKI